MFAILAEGANFRGAMFANLAEGANDKGICPGGRVCINVIFFVKCMQPAAKEAHKVCDVGVSTVLYHFP